MPPQMTPREFVEKWRPIAFKESAAAKEHFVDLCRLLGHETPAEGDPKGTQYTFVAGASPADLKARSLTNLYNRRPTWLENAHRALDERCSSPTAGRRTSRTRRCWRASLP